MTIRHPRFRRWHTAALAAGAIAAFAFGAGMMAREPAARAAPPPAPFAVPVVTAQAAVADVPE